MSVLNKNLKIYKSIFLVIFIFLGFITRAQDEIKMTSDLLWSIGRMNGAFVFNEGKTICYTVTIFDIVVNKGQTFIYTMNVDGTNVTRISAANASANSPTLMPDGSITFFEGDQVKNTSRDFILKEVVDNYYPCPKGAFFAFSHMVQEADFTNTLYPEFKKTTAKIYDNLMYRHWDTWSNEQYQHIFIQSTQAGAKSIDIMAKERHHSPSMPFGGTEDMAWSPDGNILAYVCVKKAGKEYALSTNSDIYFYDLKNQTTTNFTNQMMGYDKSPRFSKNGETLAWLSMERDGYEADKVSLWVSNRNGKNKVNLTKDWDGTIDEYCWVTQNEIYFIAPYQGLKTLFKLSWDVKSNGQVASTITKISKDKSADFSHIIGLSSEGNIIVSKTSFNHAAELYSFNPKDGSSKQITHINDLLFNSIEKSPVESRITKTQDGQNLFSWVIYPPNFDPNKKYPCLLYCQGGPQSALTQFYSFRWNMQLMAAKGYIILAPNRRGMPGWGQKWNEDISGDWGGKAISDYLVAIDDLSKEKYIDKTRIAAVGASYGGYAVYMLAGIHQKRFKTFIAHCGLYNMESWYGSTEELWFANFDLKGPFWNKNKSKSYTEFNPKNLVDKWDTPILIFEGEKDFRVPYTQGLEAFQAAQLQGLKSRLIVFSDENHWVTKPQNGIVWQDEFFRWLEETL